MGKKTDVKQLFFSRLRREGRYEDYEKVLRRMMLETGKSALVCQWEAMRECGFDSAADERKRVKEWKDNEKAIAEAASEQRRLMSFEDALQLLPPHAPRDVEQDWVKSHAAMNRKARMKDQTKDVLITADDILDAPNGRCPSMYAANMLVNWANNPREFFKQRMSEEKKVKGDGTTGAGEQVDPSLQEIRKYLSQLKGRNTDE